MDEHTYELWASQTKKHKPLEVCDHILIKHGMSREEAVNMVNHPQAQDAVPCVYFRKKGEPTYGIRVEAPAGVVGDSSVISIFEVTYDDETALNLLNRYKSKHLEKKTNCVVSLELIDEEHERSDAVVVSSSLNYGDYCQFGECDECSEDCSCEECKDSREDGSCEEDCECEVCTACEGCGEDVCTCDYDHSLGCDCMVCMDRSVTYNTDRSVTGNTDYCTCDHNGQNGQNEHSAWTDRTDQFSQRINNQVRDDHFMDRLVSRYLHHMREGTLDKLVEYFEVEQSRIESLVIMYLVKGIIDIFDTPFSVGKKKSDDNL